MIHITPNHSNRAGRYALLLGALALVLPFLRLDVDGASCFLTRSPESADQKLFSHDSGDQAILVNPRRDTGSLFSGVRVFCAPHGRILPTIDSAFSPKSAESALSHALHGHSRNPVLLL